MFLMVLGCKISFVIELLLVISPKYLVLSIQYKVLCIGIQN